MSQLTLPVVEMFDSIQGEGVWQGQPMSFVRLAGCPVGKPKVPGDRYTVCTSVTGSEFVCDTNYQHGEQVPLEVIIKHAKHPQVCITGGEPFAQSAKRLSALGIELLNAGSADRYIHFETSGTRPIAPLLDYFSHDEWMRVWVACSPKQGYLEENDNEINEWKFLVDLSTDISAIDKWLSRPTVDSDIPVSLQPINGIFDLDRNVLYRVQQALVTRPNWRLSPQLHKILGVR